MEELGTPTKTLTVRVELPPEITLPVQVDDDGRGWPMNGLMHQRYIRLDELEAIGVKVKWELPDGSPVDREFAMKLLANRQVDQDAGYVPSFTNQQNGG